MAELPTEGLQKETGLMRRLKKEAKKIEEKPPEGCRAAPIDGDVIYHWEATLIGRKGTPYEDGHFKLDIQIPEEYPFKPPNIKFITKIHHPYVIDDGVIDLEILSHLSDEWSPVYNIHKVLEKIYDLLCNPDLASVGIITPEARSKFEQTAREMTLQYAMK